MKINAVILAAGKGTRMKSLDPEHSKVSYPILGVPLVRYVVNAVRPLVNGKIYTIVGYGGDATKAIVEDLTGIVWQREQKGTGHAVLQASPFLKDEDGVTLVLCGDTPLLTTATLENLIQDFEKKGHDATVMTCVVDNPFGYGRIIRNEKNLVEGIVEQRDATDDQRKIREVNTGVYAFDNRKLFQELDNLTADNAQGELYLGDVLTLFRKKGYVIGASILEDQKEMLGINDRVQLAEAAKVMKLRINRKLMLSGVTIEDPDNTYIGPNVTIGQDTIIRPNTTILGYSTIGPVNKIGPSTYLENVTVGEGNSIVSSYITDTSMVNKNEVGPYSKIRSHTQIGSNIRIGNFVELKNAVIHDGVKAAHLSYLGDTSIGDNTNVGCGTITANYDGKNKFHTEIGKDVFLGSGTILVAPIEVGDRSITAAGSTINEPVIEDELSIARARQIHKPGYAKKYHKKD
ncbi:MAG: bifunctional UDP-N-acetylglucosamine diphosphorylase/glucosamine-1-phosphate N-acetyltransferase GlmU [Bacilli bacterium]|jgi:bifunctional UDP-N-acetylglucosamine pyrophosphorylase/glucosamine-1-phosphate N-acetyltransferase